MKTWRVSLAAMYLCFAAVTVRADGIADDGRILVGRGSDPSPNASCGNKMLAFNIMLNGNGGGIKNCKNTSGVDWIGLDISAVIPINDMVNCVPSIFSQCMFQTSPIGNSGKENVVIELRGGIITTGSASDVCTGPNSALSCFFINLNNIDPMTGVSSTDPNAAGGFFGQNGALGGNVKVQAIPAPEPGTLLLLTSGAGALCLRRRRGLRA